MSALRRGEMYHIILQASPFYFWQDHARDIYDLLSDCTYEWPCPSSVDYQWLWKWKWWRQILQGLWTVYAGGVSTNETLLCSLWVDVRSSLQSDQPILHPSHILCSALSIKICQYAIGKPHPVALKIIKLVCYHPRVVVLLPPWLLILPTKHTPL